MPDPDPDDTEAETGDHDVPGDLTEVHEAIEWMKAVGEAPAAPEAPEKDE